jgi:hypothetical protein
VGAQAQEPWTLRAPQEQQEARRVTITYQQRRELARHIQREGFVWLIANTDIERKVAFEAASNAADEHGRMLALTLEESGVTVGKESGA